MSKGQWQKAKMPSTAAWKIQAFFIIQLTLICSCFSPNPQEDQVYASGNPSGTKTNDVKVVKASNAPVKPDLSIFNSLFDLVEHKNWEQVFHYLYENDIRVDKGYNKKIHGPRNHYLKSIAKALQEDKRLKEIQNEIVFHHFLSEKFYVHADKSKLCDDDEVAEGFEMTKTTDPIFPTLKKLDSRVDKNVYIESLGGKNGYDKFLDKSEREGIFNVPGQSLWTKYCFSRKAFWLNKVGEAWAKLLGDRRQALDAAFSKEDLTLNDAVNLANWYIQYASDGGSLFVKPKSARLVKKNGNYYLSDSASQISAVVFSGKTKTVIDFDWYLED